MKKPIILLLLLTLSLSLHSQNKYTRDADRLFARYEYLDAAQAYLQLVNQGKADQYVHEQLAESYYQIFNSKEAIKWYAKLTEEKQPAETYFKYAQMLKAEGNYSAADKQMATFAAMAPNDSRAKAFKSNSNYVSEIKSQPKLYTVKSAQISSENSDYGPVLTQDNEVHFASARNAAQNRSRGWIGEPYYDLYKATYNANGTLSEATAVSELNTRWNDGPATLSADGNTMYYGSESYNENQYAKDKVNKLRIGTMYLYRAYNENGKWGNSQPLPFNSTEYSVRNPSLSKDGKTLYFSSNMPGGKGGEDIWKVSINNGQFGTPENLGDKVNTEADESFPYISDNNDLYFSSNGKQGLGGFDVYKINLSKDASAKNLGEPVNTEKDDFSFSYNDSKKVGFFSSNRSGNDNLYLADPVCGIEIKAIVRNAKTGKTIEDAQVNYVESNGAAIESKTSNRNGEAFFGGKCDTAYALQVSKTGYENGVFNIAKSAGGEVVVYADMQPIAPVLTDKEVVLQPIYFEFDMHNITAQAAEELDKLVAVMNEKPEMVIYAKSHTDNRGSDRYNMNLSDRRAKATVQYIISKGINKDRISGKGFGESEPKADCGKDCTEEQHAQNRRSEFMIVKK